MEEMIAKYKNSKPSVGIVVPCHNEEEVLPSTRDELVRVLRTLEDTGTISPKSFIVFVDDGSTDKTWDIIERLYREAHGKIRAIKLSRNFGHQNALLCGMVSFDCDVCITIDADLQDPPDGIVEMINKYKEGYDIVYGVRKKRKSDMFFKRFTAKLFYALMKFLGVNILCDHADFRLLSKEAIKTMKSFEEFNIFLRGIIPYMGFHSAVIYYDRSRRKSGSTKYTLRKMLHFAWEGITSFSIVPLRIISCVGFIIFIASVVISSYFAVLKFLGKTIIGWASIILSVYILSGLIILFIGIVGEYIGKIYLEVKRRPRFIIEQKVD